MIQRWSPLQEFRIYAFKVRQDHQRWLDLEALTNERRLVAHFIPLNKPLSSAR